MVTHNFIFKTAENTTNKSSSFLEILPGLKRLIIQKKPKIAILGLRTLSNLWYWFGVNEILDEGILIKLFLTLNGRPLKIMIGVFETMIVLVENSNEEQLQSIIEDGILDAVWNKTETFNDFELIQLYIQLIYAILQKEKDFIGDKEALERFRELGGFEYITSLTMTPNDKIQKLAEEFLYLFADSDVEDNIF